MIETSILEETSQNILDSSSKMRLNGALIVQISSKNRDGTTIKVVTERVNGLNKLNLLELLKEDDTPLLKKIVDTAISSDQILEFEFQINTRNA
jgi:hypothetical protein